MASVGPELTIDFVLPLSSSNQSTHNAIPLQVDELKKWKQIIIKYSLKLTKTYNSILISPFVA